MYETNSHGLVSYNSSPTITTMSQFREGIIQAQISGHKDKLEKFAIVAAYVGAYIYNNEVMNYCRSALATHRGTSSFSKF